MQYYVDAAYYYSSLVYLSVFLSVVILSLAKMAELIELPFEMWSQVSQRNHVLEEGPDPAWEVAVLTGEWRQPIVK